MVINSSGNVGINETSLTEKLEVNGAIVWKGALTTSKTSAGVLDRSANDLRIRAYGATSGTGNLVFRTGGGGGSVDSEAMRIDSSGNVGINDTTPDAKLDVELAATNTYSETALNTPNIIVSNRNSSNVNSQASIISLRSTGWAGSTTGVVNLAAIQAGNASSAHFAIQTRNGGTYGERLRITSGGNVGISNTTPVAKLTVGADISSSATGISVNAGAGGGNILALGSTNHNWFPFSNGQNYYSSDQHNFRNSSHGTTFGVWNSTGLGIGTTNPQNKLHVVEGTSHWETAEFQSSNTTGCGITLVGANTGVQWSLVANAQGGAGANNLGFHLTNNGTSSDSTGYKMIIDSNGYVGIGTQPSHKLHLKQNSNAHLINLIEQDNASYEAWYEAKSQNSGYVRFGISTNANAYAFFNTSVTSYNWYHTGGGLLMTLNSNGHLGLGITNLTFAKLAVNGAIYSSGGTFNAGTDTVTDAAFVLDEGDYIYTRDGSQYARKLIGKNTSDIIQIGQAATSLIDGMVFYSGNNADYKWYRNTSIAMQLYGSGSQPYEILDVKGRIYAETDNGNQALISRTLAINYQGASGSVDIDPVALFGASNRGGYLLLEVNGWQTRFNAGYIHWHNNGGTGAIGTGSVTYRQTAWSGSASGAGVTVSTISSSTNVIRISFSGWHTNAHGWLARLTWRG